MPHVKHECPKMPEGTIESLQKCHGWEDEKMIPLNTDSGHTECPYCKMPVEEMKQCSSKEVRMLSKRIDG